MQILPSLITGGVERGAIDVTQALTIAGWRAIVVSSGGPMMHEVERAGGLHIQFPAESKNPITAYRNIGRLVRLIKKHKVDILHARSRVPGLGVRFGLPGKPVLSSSRPFTVIITLGTLSRNSITLLMARGDLVIAISQFIGDQVCDRYGVPAEKVRVVPRGA